MIRRSRIIRGAILAGVLFAVGGVAHAQQMALAPGDTAPPVRGYVMPTNDYRQIDYTQQRFSIVNFWATWCAPCKLEMPKLDELHQKYADDGLEVVGIYSSQLDTDEDIVRQFLAEVNVNYGIIRAHRLLDRDWRGIGITPTTFLIDGQGKILRRYVGATEEQTEGLVADVEALLAGEPMPPQVIPVVPEQTTEADRPKQGSAR
jgi:thiol-disulfide isomerase/thioredoxin